MATSAPNMPSTSPAARKQKKLEPEPKPLPQRSTIVACLAPALASGAILWMCYHPLSWGWLGWVALVPMLCLMRSECRPRTIYLSAWAGGALFFFTALQWMRVADWRMYFTWLMLAFYCSLYFPLGVWLTRVVERRTRLPLALTFPAVWVGLEYFRAFFITGFPWYYLAHTQHEFLTIIQVTDLGGTFTVSVLVAAVNAIMFDLLYQFPDVRNFFRLAPPRKDQRTFGDDWPALGALFFGAWRRNLIIDVFVVGALLVAAYVYGEWRLDQHPLRAGPIVALLQGNIDQAIRNEAHEGALDPKEVAQAAQQRVEQAALRVSREYDALCKLAHKIDPHPHLFVWPETSYPWAWFMTDKDVPSDGDIKWRALCAGYRMEELEGRDTFHKVFKQYDTAQLLGIMSRRLGTDRKERLYNSALLLNAQANPDARYDKMHRVPFGEYVPLRDWLPFMNWFAPYDFDYSVSPGEQFTRFSLNDEYRFGVLICFEDTDPFLARHYVRDEDDGKPVDFLVNISNDGWFHGTSEHEEHLAVSRFRAIECRRAMLRSVNMGISAVIDASGRVLKGRRARTDESLPIWEVDFGGVPDPLPHAEWAAYKKVSGVLVARVPIDNRFSLYAYAGDWLAGICWLLIGIATIGTWLYARFRPPMAQSPVQPS